MGGEGWVLGARQQGRAKQQLQLATGPLWAPTHTALAAGAPTPGATWIFMAACGSQAPMSSPAGSSQLLFLQQLLFLADKMGCVNYNSWDLILCPFWGGLK